MTAPDRAREKELTEQLDLFTAGVEIKMQVKEKKKLRALLKEKVLKQRSVFLKPMVTTAIIVMETESLSANQTKVSWSNAGTLKYPVSIMIPMLEKASQRNG